jgi:phospholipid-translocating ATPase
LGQKITGMVKRSIFGGVLFLGMVHCEKPNPDFYQFSGTFSSSNRNYFTEQENSEKIHFPLNEISENNLIPLSTENLFLRVKKKKKNFFLPSKKGSVLRNTEWSVGVVVYSGSQTKSLLNTT